MDVRCGVSIPAEAEATRPPLCIYPLDWSQVLLVPRARYVRCCRVGHFPADLPSRSLWGPLGVRTGRERTAHGQAVALLMAWTPAWMGLMVGRQAGAGSRSLPRTYVPKDHLREEVSLGYSYFSNRVNA